MHEYIHEYGPAPLDIESEAQALFPYKDMTPVQYAARYAHRWACFSFDDYIYSDPELNEWIHSLGDILFTAGAVEEARKAYLSPAEIEAIEHKPFESFR